MATLKVRGVFRSLSLAFRGASAKPPRNDAPAGVSPLSLIPQESSERFSKPTYAKAQFINLELRLIFAALIYSIICPFNRNESILKKIDQNGLLFKVILTNLISLLSLWMFSYYILIIFHKRPSWILFWQSADFIKSV